MGMTLADIQKKEEELLFRGYARYPLAITKGSGRHLWDSAGKKYLDLLGGIAVVGLGHANEEIAEVISAQARRLVHVSNLFYQQEQLELAERMLKTAHFDKVFFCNSGAEANEAAIKLVRRYAQRVKKTDAFEVISFTSCFHGRTMATVAATGQERFQDGFAPMPQGFVQIEWGNLLLLEQTITDKTAAVILEAIQGEGGVRPATPAFIKGVADICRKKGVLFIMDEIQCGMGRTGKWWGFQHYGIQPDIITVAKSLANGIPMGAMMATDEVARGFTTGSHATTFGGGALQSAVAAKVFEIIERDNLLEHVTKLGEWSKKRFAIIAEKYPGTIKEIRGAGLMIGIDMVKPARDIWEQLLERGIIVNLTQETVLRLLPALTVTQEELEYFATTLEAIVQEKSK